MVSKAKAEGPLATHSEAGKQGGRGKKAVDNINSLPKGGTGASYLARRLLRDNPDIFAELERGEHKSVRAAAIAAEIVKVPSALEVAQRAFLKLSVREKHESGTWLVNGY